MPKAAHPDSNLTAGLDEALERSAKIPLTNLKCPVRVIRYRFGRDPFSTNVRFPSNADRKLSALGICRDVPLPGLMQRSKQYRYSITFIGAQQERRES